MRIRVVFLMMLLMGVLALIVPITGAYANSPQITATAAVLICVENGQVYFAKNHTIKHEPASLTKIMTAVVALENGDLNSCATVGRNAAAVTMGSTINLHEGDKLTLSELLKAALVCSANDSTVAIAEQIGGEHDFFVAMMNKKAATLGLLGTKYVNTNGFHDPQHYTTAYDLALLTRYALGNPEFNRLIQIKETKIKWVEPVSREQAIANTNRLLTNNYTGIDGVKTGTTEKAGNCLIASASKDGRRLIAVALHSDDRYRDCINMLEYGFNVIRPVMVTAVGEVVDVIPVSGGASADVPAVAENELYVWVDPSDISGLEKNTQIIESLTAPIKAGQKVGEVAFTCYGQELGRVNLLAGCDVNRPFWPKQVWDKSR